MLVEDRRGGATEEHIAAEKMLVAVDGQRPLLDEASSDAVGAFELLAPHRAGPQAPGIEGGIIARGAAPIDDDAVAISQQHRAADSADSEKQPVEVGLSHAQ